MTSEEGAIRALSDVDLQRQADAVVDALLAAPDTIEQALPQLTALQAELDARRSGRERFRDIAVVTEYGLAQELSCPVRTF